MTSSNLSVRMWYRRHRLLHYTQDMQGRWSKSYRYDPPGSGGAGYRCRNQSDWYSQGDHLTTEPHQAVYQPGAHQS